MSVCRSHGASELEGMISKLRRRVESRIEYRTPLTHTLHSYCSAEEDGGAERPVAVCLFPAAAHFISN